MGTDISKLGASKRTDALWYNPEDLTVITSKRHPLYDERVKKPISEKFVESILAHGVIEPVIARTNGVDEDGKPLVEVIAGRRRTRGALMANRILVERGDKPIKIQVILKKCTDAEAVQIMNSENEQREDDDVIVKASKIARMLANGCDDDDCAVTFGVAKGTIKSWLTLLNLVPDAQKAVVACTLSQGAALALAKLPREEQVKALPALLAQDGSAKAAAREVSTETERRQPKRASGARSLKRPALVKASSTVMREGGPEKHLVAAVLQWASGDASALEGDDVPTWLRTLLTPPVETAGEASK